MIPDVNRDELLAAIEEFDAHERGDDSWLENRAHRYALTHEGRRYPVKRVISLATGTPVSQFSGGRESNRYVRQRGFDVIELWEGPRLRHRVSEILASYDSPQRGAFGKESAVYQTFMEAGEELQEVEPVSERNELRVKASAGTGNWARVPWIALMDQRETTSTQHGIYVVYLFRQDMSGVYLTFNQGVTQLYSDRGAQEARNVLHERAEAARAYADHLSERGFALDNETIDLRTNADLGKRYQESTIAHKFYPADDLPSDDELIADLEAALKAYDAYLEVAGSDPAVEHEGPWSTTTTEAQRVERALDWIRAQGYYFEPWQLATFVAAGRTKPFVILAGVSGTGKTKLPQLLASSTSSTSITIPVRPDWTDSTDLLGYRDLQGNFQPGELLRFCKRLEEQPEVQGICIIDEMNLARVEYYFAELLSRIEDESALSGQQPLVTSELSPDDAHWASVSLPPNVLLAGTVNMDESTHGFSKKVLDRAFTLEFSRVSLSEWQTPDVIATEPQAWSSRDWQPRARRLSQLERLSQHDRSIISTSIEALEEANNLLQHAQLQIGYRVRDELALFRLHAEPLQEMMVDAEGEPVDALDIGLNMKLLPRISGGSNLIRRLLQELLGWAWRGDPQLEEAKIEAAVSDWESAGAREVLPGAKYPRTAGRLCLMWQRLQSEGFTSYWL